MGKAKASTQLTADRTTTSGGASGTQQQNTTGWNNNTTGNTQTNSTGVDASTQAANDAIRAAAARAAAGGAPSSVTGAGDYYSSQMGYGNQGNAALNGDASAAAKYMNPYQAQVVDQMNKQFANQNIQTANQMNDAATRAGAFGGSRHGVATGVALAQNQQNQAGQLAGLMQSGFNGAMDRAGQAATQGYNAAGAGANLGMTAGSPDLWAMNVLRQGNNGLAYGTNSTQTQTGYNNQNTGQATDQNWANRNNQATTALGSKFNGEVRIG